MSNVLQEFLIAIGFKVDAASGKKLKDATEGVARNAKAMALSLEAAAVAATEALRRISKEFEDLYYASQRSGAAVAKMQSFSYGVAQMGGDAKAATAALEQMGELFRSNPAYEAYMNGLGVKTKDAAGNMRDMVDVANDFSDVLSTMSYPEAVRRAQQFGIDPKTLQALARGTKDYQEQRHKMAQQFGVDSDKLAADSVKFMQEFRAVSEMVVMVSQSFVVSLQPAMQKAIDWFNDLSKATNGLSVILIGVAAALVPILLLLGPWVAGAIALGAAVGLLAADFKRWGEGASSFIDWKEFAPILDSLAEKFKGVWEALKELGGAFKEVWSIFQPFAEYMGSRFLTLLGRVAEFILVVFTNNLRGLADVINIIVDLLTGNWKKAWADATKWATDWGKAFADAGKAGLNVLKAIHDFMTGRRSAQDTTSTSIDERAQQQTIDRLIKKNGTGGGYGAVAGDVRNMAGYVTDFFIKKGVTKEVARGITAGIYAESRLDPNIKGPNVGKGGRISQAHGLGQMLGPRRAELFRKYGPNPTAEQQLEHIWGELLGGDVGGPSVLRSRSAQEAASNYLRNFMRPGAKDLPADLGRAQQYLNSTPLSSGPAAVGKQPINFTQTTSIRVDGSTSPEDAGRLVSQAQTRVNSDLARQLKTSIA